MIYDIFSVLSICSVQFVGDERNVDTHLKLYRSTNSIPLVLNVISAFDYGKYTAIYKYFETTNDGNDSWKISQHYQFKSCEGHGTVTILLTDFNDVQLVEESIKKLLRTVLIAMCAMNENPKYIFVESMRNDEKNLKKVYLPIDIFTLPITSSLLVFTRTNLYLPSYFQVGINSSQTLFTVVHFESQEPSFTEFSNKVHRSRPDFSRKQLSIYNAPLSVEEMFKDFTDCSLLRDKWAKYPDLCTLKLISETLNFTFPTYNSPNRHNPHPPGLAFGASLTPVYVKFIRSRKFYKFEILSSVFRVDNYGCVVYTNQKLSNFRGLLDPFDTFTWISLVSCIVGTVTLLKLLVYSRTTHVLWWILLTFLSQSSDNDLRKSFSNKQLLCSPLIFSWCVLCILLSQLYQGNIFTCLITQVLPQMPSSIQEILDTNIPLLEIGKTYFKGEYVSSIKEFQIAPYTKSATALGAIIPKWMEKLEKSLKSVRSPKYTIINMMLLKDYRFLENNTTSLDTFAVLDTMQMSNEFSMLMNDFVPEYESVKLQETYPFNNRGCWLMDRNIMLSKFRLVLAGVVENGIYHYWQRHFKSQENLLWLNYLFNLGKYSDLQKSGVLAAKFFDMISGSEGKIVSYVSTGPERTKKNSLGSNEAKPVSLSSVFQLLAVTLTLFLILISLFLYEVIFVLIKKKLN